MTKRPRPTHCRLSIIMATDAPRAVILRRGPSHWVQLILWETDTDTFSEGQWFKGRIYEDCCDLSPDGTLFAYFASKQHFREHGEDGYTNVWIGISKPPYFTALALWPQTGTYGGRSYFLDNQTVCVAAFGPAHPKHQPPDWLRINPDGWTTRHSPSIWRMLQSGWMEHRVLPLPRKAHVDSLPVAYHKTSPDGAYTLIQDWHGYSNYISFRRRPSYGRPEIVTCTVRRNADGAEFLVSDLWSDWDRQGRLVYAQDGKLYRAEIMKDGIKPQLLSDFNVNRPTQLVSPEWARHW
jgi:hypothetical protein